jgi:hypothetical protein
MLSIHFIYIVLGPPGYSLVYCLAHPIVIYQFGLLKLLKCNNFTAISDQVTN